MSENSADGIPSLLSTAVAVLRRPRQRREVNAVLDEYSPGWASYRQHLDSAASLDEWLVLRGIDDRPRHCIRDGHVEYSGFDTVTFYRQSLLATIDKHFPDARSVTEYGSGLGRNLLFIKRARPHLDVYGYELCSPGVEIGRRAAEKFGLDVKFSQLDFTSTRSDGYVFPVTDVAFTMFALEQVPRGVSVALQNFLGHVRLGTIHMEPVTEHYPWSVLGVLGRIDHWKVDYLSGFPHAVNRLGVRSEHWLLNSSHNALMFPSVYVLHRDGAAGSASSG